MRHDRSGGRGPAKVAAGIAAAASLVGGAALAAPAPGPGQTPAPSYVPSVADLMNIAIQPRHAKLGVALKARNFTYAEYEVRELRNAFARIVRTLPMYDGQDTAQLMAVVQPSIQALDEAVKARDPGRSLAAFDNLTATCNACHTTLGRSYIAIVAPAASTFSNQDFRPPRR